LHVALDSFFFVWPGHFDSAASDSRILPVNSSDVISKDVLRVAAVAASVNTK
jgi:hypothetical protein